MAVFFQSLFRGTQEIASTRMTGGAQRYLPRRALTTNTKSAVESQTSGSQTTESQEHTLNKRKEYIEDNAHKFGGWYYATSLAGGGISIFSGVMYTFYKSLDNHFTRRIDALDTRLTGRMDALDKNMSE